MEALKAEAAAGGAAAAAAVLVDAGVPAEAAAAAVATEDRPSGVGRGLHSTTSQLNLSRIHY